MTIIDKKNDFYDSDLGIFDALLKKPLTYIGDKRIQRRTQDYLNKRMCLQSIIMIIIIIIANK